MKVVIFGASGMIGQAVLRECLLDTSVSQVLTVVRSALGKTPATEVGDSAKLRELVHQNFLDFSPLRDEFQDVDACFFCLGISSAGLNEADYDKITYGYTAAAAETLYAASPQLSFVFISGAGTDSSEKGRVMWARVKGKAENKVLGMGFKGAYAFRPGFIMPLHGIRSRTRAYRIAYLLIGPLFPLFRMMFPRQVLTTDQLAGAMMKAAKNGAPKRVLEAPDIVGLVR